MASSEVSAYGQTAGSTASLIITSFTSVTLYIIVDLHFQMFTTFSTFRSLYFRSVLIATWGIAINAVGYLLRHHELDPTLWFTSTLILIGWCGMVTGQSVVLYSRLHLLVVNDRILRAVLTMIILNAIWLHIPGFVLHYGSNSPKAHMFRPTYKVYEPLQLTVFFLQEIIISGLYLWKTRQFLQLRQIVGSSNAKKTMRHLIYVNIGVILLDITIISLEFANLYAIQMVWKTFAYATKLKFEFSILNRLVDLFQAERYTIGNIVTVEARNDVPLEIFGSSNAPAGVHVARCDGQDKVNDHIDQRGRERKLSSDWVTIVSARSNASPRDHGSLNSETPIA